MVILKKVEIKKGLDKLGVFAKELIKKGETIFIFEGKILSHIDKFSIQLDENKHLSGSGDIDDNLNHSCDPNGYLDFNTLEFKALKDIPINEEITMNYLTTEYELSNPFQCKCKSKNCLGTIKGFKYLNDSEKKQIVKLLSPYLRTKL